MASAAHTAESMPPLASTTARDRLGIGLDSLKGRVPYKFVQLESEAGGDVVGDDPFGQLLRIEQAVRTVAGAGGVFAEHRGKQDGIHAADKVVRFHERPGEVVVSAA